MSEQNKRSSHTAMDKLLPQIRELITQARSSAVRAVNTLQVVTNFEIGRLLVEQEQHGAVRAEYGKAQLKELSEALTQEFGKGFSHRNLDYMRKFYLAFKNGPTQISQTPSAKLPNRLSRADGGASGVEISQTPSAISKHRWSLSWSHYLFLMGIKDPDVMSALSTRSRPQPRTGPCESCDASSTVAFTNAWRSDETRTVSRELAKDGQLVTKPEQIIKDPYVLEFLGLREETRYSERELETAIIEKLEHFLLELGKGFLFEARQKRFSFDEKHFFVDLVFYNRLLSCYVLIDLKIGELTHQDLGQMQMYVNYYDRYEKRDNEHPTVGIILCRKKNEAMVEITLPDRNIYASEYQLYLPSKEELRRKLLDWAEEVEE